MTFGENLARLRKAAGVTQKELADHLGIYATNVCKWETNNGTPTMGKLPKIAAIIGCSIADMFKDVDEEDE